jgi:hypothetical protein
MHTNHSQEAHSLTSTLTPGLALDVQPRLCSSHGQRATPWTPLPSRHATAIPPMHATTACHNCHLLRPIPATCVARSRHHPSSHFCLATLLPAEYSIQYNAVQFISAQYTRARHRQALRTAPRHSHYLLCVALEISPIRQHRASHSMAMCPAHACMPAHSSQRLHLAACACAHAHAHACGMRLKAPLPLNTRQLPAGVHACPAHLQPPLVRLPRPPGYGVPSA